ncbi:MAG: acyl-CoA thioesterase, partial [Myxococcaceae bacterium]|nr:acyl-CoA thioesterase [Myxococcaceae bacterium]
ADPAGIAFFGRIIAFCHDAYEDLMRDRGVPLHELVTQGEIGLPLANASADFLRPLPHGADVTVEVRVAELREKGFTLEHTVIGPGGDPHARVKTVHVAISRATKRPIPLPERIAKALNEEAP